jgi:hypothetical protein
MVKEVTIDGRRYYVVDGMVFATREAALEYLRGKR